MHERFQEKKIGIVFIGDLFYCPYVTLYISILETYGLQYDVIYWNRSGQDDAAGDHYISYKKTADTGQHKVRKAADFWAYRNWLVMVLKRNRYNKLVILSSLTGILLFPELIRYKNRYIFDIRDYSYERFIPYFMAERMIIKNSAFTTISSAGFRHFLPVYPYLYNHNLSVGGDHRKKFCLKKRNSGKIKVVWMGALRYFDHHVKIIEKLSMDGRFELFFHGEGPQYRMYEEYMSGHSWPDVHFTGRYDNRRKLDLILEADLLNNSYEHCYETLYALSNKFYDGAVYRVPQFTEAGTYKAALVEKFSIGIALDVDEPDFAEKLYRYYMGIDETAFDKGCNRLLKIVNKQTALTRAKIRQFILGGEEM